MSERLRLFDAYGIELEYMLVDRESLDVRPIADRLLVDEQGAVTGDVELGEISWSNELVLHVLEMKCSEPARALEPLVDRFQAAVARANELLIPHGARLLPTAMHPWMNPFTEMHLWPHDYSAVYEAFHRLFDCRGHGWANLQSMHVNLPFGSDAQDDDEFGRLHAAIRLLLPILPALAASSPIADAAVTGLADTRLEVYRKNSARIPSIAGRVIPEPVFTRAQYEQQILARIYADVAPHDPQGVLAHEWCNARGAIARFDRSAIEIRVLDLQECPRADLAIAALVSSAIEALASERWIESARQRAWQVEPLAKIFSGCIAQGERCVIEDAAYLALFGVEHARSLSAGDLWRHLRERVWSSPSPRSQAFGDTIDALLREGTLSSRIVRALGREPSHDELRELYGELADCLAAGRLFVA